MFLTFLLPILWVSFGFVGLAVTESVMLVGAYAYHITSVLRLVCYVVVIFGFVLFNSLGLLGERLDLKPVFTRDVEELVSLLLGVFARGREVGEVGWKDGVWEEKKVWISHEGIPKGSDFSVNSKPLDTLEDSSTIRDTDTLLDNNLSSIHTESVASDGDIDSVLNDASSTCIGLGNTDTNTANEIMTPGSARTLPYRGYPTNRWPPGEKRDLTGVCMAAIRKRDEDLRATKQYYNKKSTGKEEVKLNFQKPNTKLPPGGAIQESRGQGSGPSHFKPLGRISMVGSAGYPKDEKGSVINEVETEEHSNNEPTKILGLKYENGATTLWVNGLIGRSPRFTHKGTRGYRCFPYPSNSCAKTDPPSRKRRRSTYGQERFLEDILGLKKIEISSPKLNSAKSRGNIEVIGEEYGLVIKQIKLKKKNLHQIQPKDLEHDYAPAGYSGDEPDSKSKKQEGQKGQEELKLIIINPTPGIFKPLALGLEATNPRTPVTPSPETILEPPFGSSPFTKTSNALSPDEATPSGSIAPDVSVADGNHHAGNGILAGTGSTTQILSNYVTVLAKGLIPVAPLDREVLLDGVSEVGDENMLDFDIGDFSPAINPMPIEDQIMGESFSITELSDEIMEDLPQTSVSWGSDTDETYGDKGTEENFLGGVRVVELADEMEGIKVSKSKKVVRNSEPGYTTNTVRALSKLPLDLPLIPSRQPLGTSGSSSKAPRKLTGPGDPLHTPIPTPLPTTLESEEGEVWSESEGEETQSESEGEETRSESEEEEIWSESEGEENFRDPPSGDLTEEQGEC